MCPDDERGLSGRIRFALGQANRTIDKHGSEVYTRWAGTRRPLPDELRKAAQASLFEPQHRVRLVAGFFNESLTAQLARLALPARYVEFDADLAVSTSQALRWMCTYELLVQGSLVAYDDWFEAPFLRGGESLAHSEIAREFLVEFELLAGDRSHDCRNSITFRVVSIGSTAHTGISAELAWRSCRTLPENAPLRVSVDDCLRRARKVLQGEIRISVSAQTNSWF